MSYLKWNEKTITDFSDKNINRIYNDGYLFGRINKGYVYQTRSIRIDLNKFELSSENRRILRKTENLKLSVENIPYKKYNWEIGKLAKDFYETKFGKGIFSANKIKELLTTEHNFNKLLKYNVISNSELITSEDIGYAICFESDKIFHYSYPFYNLNADKNTGMSMMLQAINYAKKNNKKYIYLGSAKDEKAKYKLQFKELEWFDGREWSDNLDKLKQQIKQNK